MSDHLHHLQVSLLNARLAVAQFKAQLEVRCTVVVATRDKLWLADLQADVMAAEKKCTEAGLDIILPPAPATTVLPPSTSG